MSQLILHDFGVRLHRFLPSVETESSSPQSDVTAQLRDVCVWRTSKGCSWTVSDMEQIGPRVLIGSIVIQQLK